MEDETEISKYESTIQSVKRLKIRMNQNVADDRATLAITHRLTKQQFLKDRGMWICASFSSDEYTGYCLVFFVFKAKIIKQLSDILKTLFTKNFLHLWEL